VEALAEPVNSIRWPIWNGRLARCLFLMLGTISSMVLAILNMLAYAVRTVSSPITLVWQQMAALRGGRWQNSTVVKE
jgi:hypothetical protein